MEKLDKAYEAVDLLENLGLPVSAEQLNGIAQMEKDYLQNEIIPLIKQELVPLVEKMRNAFQLNLTYSKEEGIQIQLKESVNQVKSIFPKEESKGYRKKKFIIRVVFPNNRVSCQKIVANTFFDVIKYAGAENVERLGIVALGQNIITNELHEKEQYRPYQREIEPGLYVNTFLDTDKKYEVLKMINRELNLNLTIEKVLSD
ncbi:MAG: hypothetical protein IJ618_03610 [Prevotella sp.]|nr:hypothetical protein [Prevotella sp.]